MRAWKHGFVLVLGLGCASGGASGPTFEYGPTSSPARYDILSRSSALIDSPMGIQETGDSTLATVVIEVGNLGQGSHEVAVTFEAMTVHLVGAVTGTTDGGELLNRRLLGTLSPTGRIHLVAENVPMVGEYDPTALLTDFLVPMPMDGNTAEPWTVRTSMTVRGQIEVTSEFDGTAQIVGDTIWNGQAAKIIRADGRVTQNGSGQPSESPVPIEFSWTGNSTRTYIWDHLAGMMLAAVVTEEVSGPLTLVGLDMSLQATAEGTTRIRMIQE